MEKAAEAAAPPGPLFTKKQLKKHFARNAFFLLGHLVVASELLLKQPVAVSYLLLLPKLYRIVGEL